VTSIEGESIVPHTDGLAERRREDIDAGFARPAGSLTRHQQAADPEIPAAAQA
jgi:hypothetical protein